MYSMQTLKTLFVILLPWWVIGVTYVASTPVPGVTPWGGWDGEYHTSDDAMFLAIIFPPTLPTPMAQTSLAIILYQEKHFTSKAMH